MGLRKCKCKHCGGVIEKDEPRIRCNITEKSMGNFHEECYPKFKEEKDVKDIEWKKWTCLYEYVKEDIMGYSKECQLTPNMRNKLQSLRNGSFLKNGCKLSKDGYDYDVILMTFKAKKVEINRATFGKTFEDDNHKFNYIMIIVTNAINDVMNRMDNAKKLKDREELLVKEIGDSKTIEEQNDIFKLAQSKRKKKNNKVGKLLDFI